MARERLKVEDLISKGVEAHQAGQFAKAEKFYKRAQQNDGENTDILHFLGVLYHQKGLHERAIQLIRKALIKKPEDPNYNTNLAIILNTLSRWSEAEKACLVAIKTAPRYAEAFNNLGRALAAQN